MKLDTPVVKRILIPTKDVHWWKRLWRWLSWSKRWIFCEDWIAPIGDKIYFIPKGFILDFASVPRILWPVLSPTGILQIPGALHDFGYNHGFVWLVILDEADQIVRKWKFGEGKPRSFWDDLFKTIGTLVNGIHVANWGAWAAVRLGGWHPWNKYRNG